MHADQSLAVRFISSIRGHLVAKWRPSQGNAMITNSMVRLVFILAAWIVLVPANSLIYACTAFMLSDGEKVLVGNNEDYKIPYTRVWFIPAETGRFGRVYFGYDNWSPQGGMNDQGLFFDYFAVKKIEIEQSGKKPKFQGPFVDTMMTQCATVDDVLEMLSRYDFDWNPGIQMFIVDKHGNSAIFEGNTVVRNFNAYQVVTNFRHSKIADKDKPCRWPAWSCSRYKKAKKMLLESGVPTVARFREILKATHRNNLIARTLYSNIYDLGGGLVYVYYLHDFDNEIVFNLNEELKKGHHYFDLPSLFGKELKVRKKVYTHSSPHFSIAYPKHYEAKKPTSNEVLLVRNPLSDTPQIAVYVEDIPDGINLNDIGPQYFYSKISEFSTLVNLVSSKEAVLNDGTPGVEILFDIVVDDIWPLKILILSTYRSDKLVFASVISFAHPEALRDYLYSIQFN